MSNGTYKVMEVKDGKFVLERTTAPMSLIKNETKHIGLTELTVDGVKLLPTGIIKFENIDDLNTYVNHHILKQLEIPHKCAICEMEKPNEQG